MKKLSGLEMKFKERITNYVNLLISYLRLYVIIRLIDKIIYIST